MIKIIDGDLFNTDAKFIAHQVNCMGKMMSGVALQVKERYPHVYIEYKRIVESTKKDDLFGKVQIVPVRPEYIGYDCGDIDIPNTEQWICNIFAQSNYGYDGKQYTSINALEQCFKQLYILTFEKNSNYNAKIAMPYKIGCCRGGADWNEVYAMIDKIFVNREVELWRLDKG